MEINIFALTPEDEQRIHPDALVRYKELLNDLYRVAIGGQLTSDDLNTHLSDNEKDTFADDVNQIADALFKSRDKNDGYSASPYSDAFVSPMVDIKSLLTKVYERREKQKEWEQALQVLNPPIKAAKLYLNSKEYEEFKKSIPAAARAYLAHGDSYVFDRGAAAYWFWVDLISKRQEQEENKRYAESEALEYSHRLNAEADRLHSKLISKKEDLQNYFKKEVSDNRYDDGYSFDDLLSDDRKARCDSSIKSRVHQMIPDEFGSFIHRKYTTRYFLLPYAQYSDEDLPCIDFCFDIFAVVRIEMWLKPGEKTFRGYVFRLPRREENGYSVLIRESQFLGYDYLVLTDSELGSLFWKSIPLVLAQGLMNGEEVPAGTTVLEAWNGGTTYKINAFDDGVAIPESFSGYLKAFGGVGGMVSAGLLTEKMATIIKKKLTESKINQKEESAVDKNVLGSNGASGFEVEEFISKLTSLGIAKDDAQKLLPLLPAELELSEAVRVAFQKYEEIVIKNTSKTI